MFQVYENKPTNKKTLLAAIICFMMLFLSLLSTNNNIAEALTPTVPTSTNSADVTQITVVLCNVEKQLNGPIGKPVMVIVIMITAITAFFGKIQWITVVVIVTGIAVLIGAGSIVGVITDDSTTDICATVTAAS